MSLLHAEMSDAQKRELFLNSQATATLSPEEASRTEEMKGAPKSGSHKHHAAHPSPTPHTIHRKKHYLKHSASHEGASAVSHKAVLKVSSPSPASESPQETAAVPVQLPALQASHLASSQGGHSIPGSPAVAEMTVHAEPAPATTLPSVSSATLLPDSSLPHGENPSAPITISKSGAEADQGMEPLPAPPSSSWNPLGWIFGSRQNYNYLSASVRAAIDRAPVKRGRWKYIIVHNSGTREGNARVFDIYHRRVRHMKNGLAYHFVIGDGHGSGDGEIEIGHRWTAQLNGGHVASDYLNDISLGICLVGDFNRDLPTKSQIGALEELIRYLRVRVGKVQGRQSIVYAHKEINPRPTDCPGDRFPYAWLHATFGKPD